MIPATNPVLLLAVLALAQAAPNPWTLDKARHLLDRAGFGGTPEQIRALCALGREAAVDSLLDQAMAPDPAPFAAEPLRERIREMVAAGDAPLSKDSPEARAARQKIVQQERAQAQDFREDWLLRMATGSAPAKEKVALFWHGYFTSAVREVKNSYAMIHQIELYRECGLGSFAELLHRASKEPAMLVYLSNDKNNKQAPNENFAREVMELFTLGPGHYTEQDIKEAARAFTGWKAGPEGSFRFAKFRHDDGEKTFLGHTGPLDGDAVLDVILEQDALAPFVARRMFEFFAYPDPDDAVVARLAADFRASDLSLRALLRAILLSPEFESPQAIGALIKSPVEFVASTVRRLEIASPPPGFLAAACDRLGQELLNPPNVKGWEGGENWISSATILDRSNFARMLVKGDDRALRKDMAALRAGAQGGGGLGAGRMKDFRDFDPQLDVDALTGGAGTARGVVVALCDRLLPVAPQKTTVDDLVAYVAPFGDDAFDAAQAPTRERIGDCIHLVLSLPEYQLN